MEKRIPGSFDTMFGREFEYWANRKKVRLTAIIPSLDLLTMLPTS